MTEESEVNPPPESTTPDEWLDLTQASTKYGIRRDTLINRIQNNKFPEGTVRKLPFGSKGKFQVLRSAMDSQPKVNSPSRPYTRRAKPAAVPAVEGGSVLQPDDISPHVTYAAGYVTAWLDLYARGQGLPPAELAFKVAQLLGGPA